MCHDCVCLDGSLCRGNDSNLCIYGVGAAQKVLEAPLVTRDKSPSILSDSLDLYRRFSPHYTFLNFQNQF